MVCSASCVVLASGTLVEPPESWDCDPKDYKPASPAGPGCVWEYDNGWYTTRDELLVSADNSQSTEWERLDACACGWYPSTVPCPSCPPDSISRTLTDTGTWTVSTKRESEHAFEIKGKLFSDVGYSYQLTRAEETSLSGTHTESGTVILSRQKFLCYKRFYRETWELRLRKRQRTSDWTFRWREFCGGNPGTRVTHTNGSQLLAKGSFVWKTLPQVEWAPQAPPCGGVPVDYPDPWNGKREMPCCADVCMPPAPPAHPCCGCEARH